MEAFDVVTKLSRFQASFQIGKGEVEKMMEGWMGEMREGQMDIQYRVCTS